MTVRAAAVPRTPAQPGPVILTLERVTRARWGCAAGARSGRCAPDGAAPAARDGHAQVASGTASGWTASAPRWPTSRSRVTIEGW